MRSKWNVDATSDVGWVMRMWHNKNTQLNGKVVQIIVDYKGNEFLSCEITQIAPVILVHTSESLEFPFDDLLSKMWVIRNLDSRLKKNVFQKYYSRANDILYCNGSLLGNEIQTLSRRNCTSLKENTCMTCFIAMNIFISIEELLRSVLLL